MIDQIKQFNFGKHAPHFILTTAGFPEVRHGRQFGVRRILAEPSVVQHLGGFHRVLFASELELTEKVEGKIPNI